MVRAGEGWCVDDGAVRAFGGDLPSSLSCALACRLCHAAAKWNALLPVFHVASCGAAEGEPICFRGRLRGERLVPVGLSASRLLEAGRLARV